MSTGNCPSEHIETRCLRDAELDTIVRPATPPGIEVYTPQRSQSPETDSVQELSDQDRYESDDSPWWQHSNLLNPSNASTPIGKNSNLERFEARQDWITEILNDLNAQLKNRPDPQSANRSDGAVIVPPSPAQNPPQIQLVKVFRNVVSKTLDFQSATAAVLRLTHNHECLPVLQRLLHLSDVSMVKIFAQQLLVPAARDGNIALVRTLIESGIDPNRRVSDKSAPPRQRRSTTALQYAVYNRRKDLTEYLLQHGATDWHADLYEVEGTLSGTIFDVIIERDKDQQWMGHPSRVNHARSIDRDMFRMLLESKPCGSYTAEEGSLRTLRFAVLRNRLDYVDLLFYLIPQLQNSARKHPWILLEAAASVEGISMFQALAKRGLDINATDSNGYGSALVSAVENSNDELVRYLIAARVDPNGIAFGLGDQSVQGAITRSEERLRQLHGSAALHIATKKNNEDIVSLLLNHGAQTNLDCGAYPVQLAASNGNVSVLEKLLDAGADVNAISSNITTNIFCFRDDGAGPAKRFTTRTALRIAFENGSLPTVDMLRKNGGRLHSNVDMGSLAAWDPLHIAIQNRNGALVRYVLGEVYSDLSNPGQLIRTPNARDHCDLANELMDIGLLGTRAVCQLAVMCAGITLQKTSLVEHILHQMISTPVEVVPRHYSRRALILAVRKRQVSLVGMFLTAGLSAFDRIAPGEEELYDLDEHYMFWNSISAFECAVELERQDILATFLTHESQHSSESGQPVVQRQLGAAYATAICTGNTTLQSMILQAGLRADDIDHIMGETQYICRRLYSALQQATQNGDLEEVEWLIERGAKPHRPDTPLVYTRDDWTPLQSAARDGHLDTVKALLCAGADVNTAPIPSGGRTALQAASEKGHLAVVRLLLEAKADVNAPSSIYQGMTAIVGAADGGHLGTVLVLLASGADVRGINNLNYRWAVYRAWKNGHQDLVRVINGWKSEQYGTGDCETIDVISASIAVQESPLVCETAAQEHGSGHEIDVFAIENDVNDTEGDGHEESSNRPTGQLLLMNE